MKEELSSLDLGLGNAFILCISNAGHMSQGYGPKFDMSYERIRISQGDESGFICSVSTIAQAILGHRSTVSERVDRATGNQNMPRRRLDEEDDPEAIYKTG